MKKLISIMMAVLLFTSATAYAQTQANQIPKNPTVEENLYHMIPVFDSFARNMGIEGEAVYDANNPQFFWTQLYLLGANWGIDNSQAVYDGSQLILPASVMQEYAAASFNGLTTLPAIPQSITSLSLEAAANTYRMNTQWMPQTFIVVERYAMNADGTLLVGIGLYDSYLSANPTRLGGLLIQVTGYSYQGTALEPAFPYSVKNVQRESAADFEGLEVVKSQIQHINELLQPVPTAEPTSDPTATPGNTPTITSAPSSSEYTKLLSGSKGEAVRELQERLEELGYDCGKIDGTYGTGTKRAVRYFQDAIGAEQDGVATSSLQKRLFSSDAPEYVTYVLLKKGDSGIRVERMQTRLRELNYLAEPMDGDFGSRTVDAVKLFQTKAKLKVDGIAGTKTLKALFKKDAPKCDEYITLKSGDTGSRVKEMQERLIKLGFLAKKASSRYDSDTIKAVQAFMKVIGKDGNGKTADKALLENLFTYTPATPTPVPTAVPTPTPTPVPTTVPTPTQTPDPAVTSTPTPTPEPTVIPTPTPTPEPTVTPTPTPTPAPVKAITDEQLNTYVTDLNTLLTTTYTAPEAVTWLQQKLNVPQNGVYDEATKTAVTTYQTNNSLIVSGIADAATLTKLNQP